MHREWLVREFIVATAKFLRLFERQPSRVDDAMPLAVPSTQSGRIRFGRTSFDQVELWMLICQQQEHRKYGPLHVPVVGCALQRLPRAGLNATAASRLKGIPHQLGSLHLAQSCGHARCLEFFATGCWHVESGDRVHGRGAAVVDEWLELRPLPCRCLKSQCVWGAMDYR